MGYTHTFQKKTIFPLSAEELFAWHERPGALERSIPPWEKVVIEANDGSLTDGSTVVLKTKIGGISKRWNIVHQDYKKNVQFCDRLMEGPFPEWFHTHHFQKIEDNQTVLTDTIHYRPPFLPMITAPLVHDRLEKTFRFRHELLYQDLVTHKPLKPDKPYRIVVTGSSGSIGSRLIPFLKLQGHTVVQVSHVSRHNTYFWDIENNILPHEAFENVDVVIHLAGASINRAWTEQTKHHIYNSRIHTTEILCDYIANLAKPPKLLICSSGVSVHPFVKTPEAPIMHDLNTRGHFLAEVCKYWELSTRTAVNRGIRVVNLRTPPVMNPGSGMLKTMLIPFMLGLGMVPGSGDQYMSWVGIDDLVDMITFCIHNEAIHGPVNCTSPNPITQREFAQSLARVLKKPLYLQLSENILKLLVGRAAEELMLVDMRAYPEKLASLGFRFRTPKIEDCLRFYLNK